MYTDEDRQSALTRALIMAGGAMTQPGPGGFAAALGRGGMMGAQSYNDSLNDIMQRKVRDEAMRRSALETKLQEIAIARQQALQGIFQDFATGGEASRPAGMARPSVVDSPDWKSNPMNAGSSAAAPSVRSQASQSTSREEDLIKRLAAGGYPAEAKAQLEIFKGLEGEVYGDPQVDRDGKVFINTKRGPRYVSGGFVPRDKLVEVNLGGKVGLRGEYDTQLRGTFDKTMTPGEVASNQVAWANYFKPELRESGTGVIGTAPDGKGGIRVIPTDIPKKAERLTSGDADKILQLDELVAKAKGAKEGVTRDPSAVGPQNAIVPNWMLNTFGTTSGIDTRARLAELSTFVLNARSGAAVTEHEYKRLEPFLATPNDSPKSAKTKLDNLIKTMEGIRESRSKFYASQGYNVPPTQFGQGGLGATSSALPGDMSATDIAKALREELARRAKAGG